MSQSLHRCDFCEHIRDEVAHRRREHWKQVHQKACTVRFSGEAVRTPIERAQDGEWHCPRCNASFQGSPHALQVLGDRMPSSVRIYSEVDLTSNMLCMGDVQKIGSFKISPTDQVQSNMWATVQKLYISKVRLLLFMP